MADWKSRATKELQDADANQVEKKTIQLSNAESAAKEAIEAAANAYKDIAEAVDDAKEAAKEAVDARAREVPEANTKDMQHMYYEAVVKAVSARVKRESVQRIFDNTWLGLSHLGLSRLDAEKELQAAMNEMVKANEELDMARKMWNEATAAQPVKSAIKRPSTVKTKKNARFEILDGPVRDVPRRDYKLRRSLKNNHDNNGVNSLGAGGGRRYKSKKHKRKSKKHKRKSKRHK